MERWLERFNAQEILFNLGLSAAFRWLEYVGARLTPEGCDNAREIFKECFVKPQERKMSEDSKRIFCGFERKFGNLEGILKNGPVLILTWHYPQGPLSFLGVPFLISEAVSQVREDEVVWLGATRFRLPFRSEGLKMGKKFGKQMIEDCYGGVYINYGEKNMRAVRQIKKALEEGGIIGLAPDDIDKTIIPPKEIERLKPEAVKFIAHLAEEIPKLSIIAAVPGFFADQTLALDFIPIEGPRDSTEEGLKEWSNLIKKTLVTSISP